ncbi:MAG: hypothetical protein Q9169_004067 [Polycauliona sp. 2 TL-2023]
MALFPSLACFVQILALTWPAIAASKPLNSTHNSNISRFAVHSLPNVTFQVPPSWAGQIPIPGVPDDRLFFWLFQAENKSASENLISKIEHRKTRKLSNIDTVWLNGGPGCSSLTGLTYENGPFHFEARTPIPSFNPYSWTKLANVLYIDQPVGTGYSTGSRAASNNAEVTNDLFLWLIAFYHRFPALKSKNTYIMGESYAGVYISYFTKALLSNQNILNFNLKAIVLGDPTLGNIAAMTDVVTTTYLHQIAPQYKIPLPILSAFAAADRQCGFDKILSQLTYPPSGEIQIPGNPEGFNYLLRRQDQIQKRQVPCFDGIPNTVQLINASINAPCSVGCATYTTAFAYLATLNTCFDPYNVRTTCDSPRDESNPTYWLNQPVVRKAIHAPNKTIESCNDTILEILSQEDVEPVAYNVLPEVLGKGVKVHIYSGDLDGLLNHWGTELVVQNMTWYAFERLGKAVSGQVKWLTDQIHRNGRQGLQHPPNHEFILNGTCVGHWGYEVFLPLPSFFLPLCYPPALHYNSQWNTTERSSIPTAELTSTAQPLLPPHSQRRTHGPTR